MFYQKHNVRESRKGESIFAPLTMQQESDINGFRFRQSTAGIVAEANATHTENNTDFMSFMYPSGFSPVAVFVSLTILTEYIQSCVGIDCSDLKPGQYLCLSSVTEHSEQPVCVQNKDNHEKYFSTENCEAVPGLLCWNGTTNSTFFKKQKLCQPTNGKDFATALLLSIFLGWLGIDRFYLGYPALGFFKLCTLGFFFVFHLVDILLIALQVVLPSDGSAYTMDYYGPKMQHAVFNNYTNFRSGR